MHGRNVFLVISETFSLIIFALFIQANLSFTITFIQISYALAWYQVSFISPLILAPIPLLPLTIIGVISAVITRKRQTAISVMLQVLILSWISYLCVQGLLGELVLPVTLDAKITVFLSILEFALEFVIPLGITGVLAEFLSRRDATRIVNPNTIAFVPRRCPHCGTSFNSNPEVCYTCGTELNRDNLS